jgi:hypothetical protein
VVFFRAADNKPIARTDSTCGDQVPKPKPRAIGIVVKIPKAELVGEAPLFHPASSPASAPGSERRNWRVINRCLGRREALKDK